MKAHILIFLIIFSQLFNCIGDKNPLEPSDIYSSKYFPLKVGNTWYYDKPTPQSNPWAVKMIRDFTKIKDKTYYIWTYGEGVGVYDTIRADKFGRILKYINGKEYLWFDFTQQNDSTYRFDYPEILGDKVYYFLVHVMRNRICETPTGTFENCIVLLFDIPEVVDEERGYTFAPDIGVVRISFDGWSDSKLTSAVINGSIIAE